MHHDPGTAHPSSPIFILGITPRSGTNFVSHLLRLHPDCKASAIWEDYFLHHSELLERYVHAVDPRRRWSPTDREPAEPLEGHMLRCLGDGILAFATSLIDHGRLVTKTPSIRNLPLFFRLFPEAHLVIIVRDGRTVTESRSKSFNFSHEEAIREWASAARDIIQFDRASKSSPGKYCIVRYEALFTNLNEELSRLFEFLALDAKHYDFAAAAALPIRGSSELRSTEGRVHWQPVQKTKDFDPLNRWAHWTRFQRQRFDWLAGEYSTHFGYTREEGLPRGMWNRMVNGVLDVLWPLKRALLPIPRGFRRLRVLWQRLAEEDQTIAQKWQWIHRGIVRRLRGDTPRLR